MKAMQNLHNPGRFAGSLTLLALLLFTSFTAKAVTYTIDGSSGHTWSDVMVMNARTLNTGDVLNIYPAAGSYTGITPATITVAASATNVTINGNGGTYSNVCLVVSSNASPTINALSFSSLFSTYTVNMGDGSSLTVQGNCNINTSKMRGGALNMSDGSTVIVPSGAKLTLDQTTAGTPTVNVTGSANFNVDGDMNVNNSAGSITFSGSQPVINKSGAGTLYVDGSGSDVLPCDKINVTAGTFDVVNTGAGDAVLMNGQNNIITIASANFTAGGGAGSYAVRMGSTPITVNNSGMFTAVGGNGQAAFAPGSMSIKMAPGAGAEIQNFGIGVETEYFSMMTAGSGEWGLFHASFASGNSSSQSILVNINVGDLGHVSLYPPDYTINGTPHAWTLNQTINLIDNDVMTILPTAGQLIATGISIAKDANVTINGNGNLFRYLYIEESSSDSKAHNVNINNLKIEPPLGYNGYLNYKGILNLSGDNEIGRVGSNCIKSSGNNTVTIAGTGTLLLRGYTGQTIAAGTLNIQGTANVTSSNGAIYLASPCILNISAGAVLNTTVSDNYSGLYTDFGNMTINNNGTLSAAGGSGYKAVDANGTVTFNMGAGATTTLKNGDTVNPETHTFTMTSPSGTWQLTTATTTGKLTDASIPVTIAANGTGTVKLNNGTGIEDVQQANTLKAWIENGTLHVSGLTAGKQWSIYNVAGILICQGIASGDTETRSIASLSKGVYIIKSGNEVVKIKNH